MLKNTSILESVTQAVCNLKHFAKKRSLTSEAAKADAVRLPVGMCSLEYPEDTISSIARTAAAALTTAAFAVLTGYRKKGNALPL